jgi:hypothetical protein
MVPDEEHGPGANAAAGAPHHHGLEHKTMMQRMTLIEDVVYEPRPLLQHVTEESLRGRDDVPERKAGYDELFFDLIIVAVVSDRLTLAYIAMANSRKCNCAGRVS